MNLYELCELHKLYELTKHYLWMYHHLRYGPHNNKQSILLNKIEINIEATKECIALESNKM